MGSTKAAPAEAARTETPELIIAVRDRIDNLYGNGCWFACHGADLTNRRVGWHEGRWVRHYPHGRELSEIVRMCDLAISRHRQRGCLVADMAPLEVGP
jgi:hypothetical protein